jgi:hypothetical protein
VVRSRLKTQWVNLFRGGSIGVGSYSEAEPNVVLRNFSKRFASSFICKWKCNGSVFVPVVLLVLKRAGRITSRPCASASASRVASELDLVPLVNMSPIPSTFRSVTFWSKTTIHLSDCCIKPKGS